MCKKNLCQGLLVPLWLRGLTWRVGLRLIKVAGSQLVVVFLPVLLTLGRRGAIGIGIPDVLQSTASSSSSASVIQVGILSNFWIQGGALLPTGLCLIWFRVFIFSLGLIQPLFHNFKWFNIKAAAAYHPIMQKEGMCCLLRELKNHFLVLLVSNASVFVVPKHTGDLFPMHNLK